MNSLGNEEGQKPLPSWICLAPSLLGAVFFVCFVWASWYQFEAICFARSSVFPWEVATPLSPCPSPAPVQHRAPLPGGVWAGFVWVDVPSGPGITAQYGSQLGGNAEH